MSYYVNVRDIWLSYNCICWRMSVLDGGMANLIKYHYYYYWNVFVREPIYFFVCYNIFVYITTQRVRAQSLLFVLFCISVSRSCRFCLTNFQLYTCNPIIYLIIHWWLLWFVFIHDKGT